MFTATILGTTYTDRDEFTAACKAHGFKPGKRPAIPSSLPRFTAAPMTAWERSILGAQVEFSGYSHEEYNSAPQSNGGRVLSGHVVSLAPQDGKAQAVWIHAEGRFYRVTKRDFIKVTSFRLLAEQDALVAA